MQNVLDQVEGVTVRDIIDNLYDAGVYENIYDYFVTDKAHKTGYIPLKDIYALLEECYMDWFFLALHQNVRNLSGDMAKAYSQLKTYRDFHPSNMGGKDYLNFFKTKGNGLFKVDKFLPIEIVKTSHVDDSFIVSIYADILHFMPDKLEQTETRLYLNIEAENIIQLVKEILHRSYSQTLPIKINFTNSDNRADTVIVCTDYMHANAVIDMLREIREDFGYLFTNADMVPKVLGRIDDFIGFGEQPKNKNTYFSQRANVFRELFADSINSMIADLLTGNSVATIVNRNNDTLTVEEYLYELVKRATLQKIDHELTKVQTSKDNNETLTKEQSKQKESIINKLYQLRTEFKYDDISKENKAILMAEVEELKEAMTRACNYTLKETLVVGGGEVDIESDYDFITKLFRTFATDKMYRMVDKEDKKTMSRLINSIMYPISKAEVNVGTDVVTVETMLYDMFKESILKELMIKINTMQADSDITTQNRIFASYKSRELKKFIRLYNKIDADDDEGKNYIYDAIYDFLRAVLMGKTSEVEIWFDENTRLILTESFKEKIYAMFPHLKSELRKIVTDEKFYNEVLTKYDINPKNIALNSNTIVVAPTLSRNKSKTKNATPKELENSILNVDVKGVNDEATYSSASEYYSSL